MNKEQEKKLNDILFTLDIMKDTCKIAVVSSDNTDVVNQALKDLKNLEEVEEITKKHYNTTKDYALFGTEVLDIITTFSTSDSKKISQIIDRIDKHPTVKRDYDADIGMFS